MTFDSVAAVQARIVQIQQLVSGTVSGVSGTGATAPTSGSSTTIGQTPEFASLLADAMATGTTGSDPLSDAPSDGSDTSIGGSSMLSQLMQLSQLSSGSGTSTALGSSSLASTALAGTGLDATDLAASGVNASTLAGLTGTSTGACTGLGSDLMNAVTGGVTGTDPVATTATNAVTQQFLNNALAEQGKPYVYGATAKISDPNPPAFDCSELTKWASARAGVTIPDGATAQYFYIRDHGDTMTVQQALHTPGALLFHFSHEPKNLGDIPADGHVAISLGDGVHTIEARGHAYGTNVFANAAGRDFDFAGMIPGMS